MSANTCTKLLQSFNAYNAVPITTVIRSSERRWRYTSRNSRGPKFSPSFKNLFMPSQERPFLDLTCTALHETPFPLIGNSPTDGLSASRNNLETQRYTKPPPRQTQEHHQRHSSDYTNSNVPHRVPPKIRILYITPPTQNTKLKTPSNRSFDCEKDAEI